MPKAVLITGGTSGIGLAAVKACSERGHTVFTCGRNVERLRELNRLPRVMALPCDVSDDESVRKMVRLVADTLGGRPLDVVVNNAGVLRIGDPLTECDIDAFEAPFRTNVRGPFLVTRHAWPLMREAPAPLVVNVGSTTEHHKFAQAFHTTYALSKTALRTYSVGLRQELAVLHAASSVTHLTVGAHATGLDHDGPKASALLASYGGPAARHAPALFAHLSAAFGMVKYHPPEHVARAICKLVEAPARSRPRELSVNVSFLERLVRWLPLALLDFFIVSALRKV
jgi:NAD(P)-dependent dehydrogenase (short-subunit alcohol dehydrogenase family)